MRSIEIVSPEPKVIYMSSTSYSILVQPVILVDKSGFDCALQPDRIHEVRSFKRSQLIYWRMAKLYSYDFVSMNKEIL